MKKVNTEPFPEKLYGPWKNFDPTKLHYPKDFKYRNRNNILKIQWMNCKRMVPDYLNHQHKSVIDISAANGATLEIFRYFGYDVQALDFYRGPNGYDLFLKSQDIPYINHDCSVFPYPIKNKQFDLLLNFGAITQYSNDISIWPKILDEFARITKETIAMVVNVGWKLKEGKKYLLNWKHPDFELVLENENKFRWDKKIIGETKCH